MMIGRRAKSDRIELGVFLICLLMAVQVRCTKSKLFLGDEHKTTSNAFSHMILFTDT